MKEITRPLDGLFHAELATVARHEQALQTPVHVVIDLPKLDGGIARAEVGAQACPRAALRTPPSSPARTSPDCGARDVVFAAK